MKVWRICRERYVESALTGEGARLAGGRWNSVDVPMVYASWCLSLAALEVFVNLDPGNQPTDLVWIAIEAPVDEQWKRRDAKEFISSLPPHWRERDNPDTRMFGDDWTRSNRSAGLVVPSVLIEGEWNVLLNPAHPDAKKIRVVEKKPFRFEERMFKLR
jgi:RES domain-containing protein